MRVVNLYLCNGTVLGIILYSFGFLLVYLVVAYLMFQTL